MKILHISDFHYDKDSKSNADYIKFVDSLLESIQDEKIDMVLFTGDLVFSGINISNFQEARDQLLKRVYLKTKNEPGRIFICCGNHDVNRNQELLDTTEIIKGISDNIKLDSFLDRQEGKSFQESLKNIHNFNFFEKEFYDEFGIKNSDFLSELYSTHYRTIENTKIGILSLNSSWRAIDSKTDRGNLLFPISILKNAIVDLKKNSDFRILLMHHPISDFKDWNASEIEDLIFSDFHMLFSGHLHKKKQSVQFSTEKGIFCCGSAASVSPGQSQNGYCIIDIDFSTYDLSIYNHFYIKEEKIFLHKPNPILIPLPIGAGKRESNEFRRLFRKRFNEEREAANELFISYDERDKGKGFLELFTDPILKQKTKAQIAKLKTDTENICISEILSSGDNFLINGKDKSGKTSILFKCLLDLLTDFTEYKAFPLYIDYKDLTRSNKQLDIYRKLSQYYEMSLSSSKDLPSKFKILLLIDNYDPNKEDYNQVINTFLEIHTSASFIATIEEKLALTFASFIFDNRKYTNLFIHEISRPEVRCLANKWPNLTPEKREIILEKIFDIFVQLNIPTNYWTVSLFIWIFEKNNDANFHNSFELIQLYIDNLLDKQRITLDRGFKMKFEDLKTYLAQLAYFLLKDRAIKGYTATYSEIVDFTNTYREKNKRFVIEVRDVIDLILNKNILKKVSEDRYTFRLNGVFEYFLALYMVGDKVFRNSVINDDHFYLSFKNEFELLAGFEKDNIEYVRMIFDKTAAIFRNTVSNYSKIKIDDYLVHKISEVFEIKLPLRQLQNGIKKPLSTEKQDEIIAELKPNEIASTEVKVKRYFEKIEDNSEMLESALHIFSRVFRNSNTQKPEDINEFLDFILNSACYLGFKLIDDFQSGEYFFEDIEEVDEKVLIQLITNFMPITVQTFLFDALAQNDLERIFLEKIEELKKDKKNNQFKLLLLYFTVIDLDLNRYKRLIDDIIDLLDLDILRQTTIVKLYIYLMFKCSGKPHLEEYVKERIVRQSRIIDPKFDKSNLQKGLIKTTRLAHLKDRGKKN